MIVGHPLFSYRRCRFWEYCIDVSLLPADFITGVRIFCDALRFVAPLVVTKQG